MQIKTAKRHVNPNTPTKVAEINLTMPRTNTGAGQRELGAPPVEVSIRTLQKVAVDIYPSGALKCPVTLQFVSGSDVPGVGRAIT